MECGLRLHACLCRTPGKSCQTVKPVWTCLARAHSGLQLLATPLLSMALCVSCSYCVACLPCAHPTQSRCTRLRSGTEWLLLLMQDTACYGRVVRYCLLCDTACCAILPVMRYCLLWDTACYAQDNQVCWHEVRVSKLIDPVTGETYLVINQVRVCLCVCVCVCVCEQHGPELACMGQRGMCICMQQLRPCVYTPYRLM